MITTEEKRVIKYAGNEKGERAQIGEESVERSPGGGVGREQGTGAGEGVS